MSSLTGKGKMSIAVCFGESEIKLKKNRSVSEYYFNLMSGAKTHEASTLPFPSDWNILLLHHVDVIELV